jgi:hypothetical protein
MSWASYWSFFFLASPPFVMHAMPISSYKLLSASLGSFPSSTSCHFISLQSKYSQHLVFRLLCLWSSLNVRNQVLHPYRNTGKIIFLYILTFTFLDSRREDNGFWAER